ncbi:MAG: hypothetical protein F2534_09845 [Actinobacteria bacterium]|nr:hypothetical protein [Actinomycetota bacterium]
MPADHVVALPTEEPADRVVGRDHHAAHVDGENRHRDRRCGRGQRHERVRAGERTCGHLRIGARDGRGRHVHDRPDGDDPRHQDRHEANPHGPATEPPPTGHRPATDEVIVDRASSTIASLDQSSHQIRQVVTLIRQVTAQSRLLALDGTIEAARAGEAGRQRRRS